MHPGMPPVVLRVALQSAVGSAAEQVSVGGRVQKLQISGLV